MAKVLKIKKDKIRIKEKLKDVKNRIKRKKKQRERGGA